MTSPNLATAVSFDQHLAAFVALRRHARGDAGPGYRHHEPDPRRMSLPIQTSCKAPAELVLEIAWPRYPLVTPQGKASKAKRAGHIVPWLNMNNVNRLPWRVHTQLRIYWRQAAREAVLEQAQDVLFGRPVHVTLQLFPVANIKRDVAGIIEGIKPVIDGFVEAGLLVNDNPQYVKGFTVLDPVPVGRKGNAGVRVILRHAQ